MRCLSGELHYVNVIIILINSLVIIIKPTCDEHEQLIEICRAGQDWREHPHSHQECAEGVNTFIKEVIMIFWTMKDVVSVTGLSESSIRRKMRDRSFPQSHKLIGRRRVWKPADIQEWADGIFADKKKNDPDKSLGFLSKFR